MELHEFDLSLFSGDLLVDVLPTSTESAHNVDRQKSVHETLADWALPHISPSQHELNCIDDVSEQQTQSWMESSMDLLELLAQSGEANLATTLDASYDCTDTSSFMALKMLQEAAQETSEMLENQLALPAAQFVKVKNEQPQSSVDESVTNIFKFLESGTECTDTFIELPQMDTNVLSPFTADEVDSILSSKPSSPCPSLTSSLIEFSADKSTSLLAHYLTNDIKDFQQPESGILDSSTDKETSDDPDYVPSYQVSKMHKKPYSREKKISFKDRKTPTEKEQLLLERKMRKKQQNKDAAIRYRQKKKLASMSVDEECEQLESRNKELKDKVAEISREIGYLKNLLADVYTAKKKITK